MQTESISVVIPAYNESQRIKPTLERIYSYLANHYSDYEIIVINDGSTDNTALAVEEMTASLPNLSLICSEKNSGKGHAVRSGVFAAKGELILMSDADLSTPIEHLEDLYAVIVAGSDIAFGSRKASGARVVKPQRWYRKMMGNTFNNIARFLALADSKDTQCGFKLMKAQPARLVFKKCICNRFCFDVEFLFLARKNGFRLSEVPVTWFNSPQSRVRIGVDSLNMLFDLLRIRTYDLVGGYRK